MSMIVQTLYSQRKRATLHLVRPSGNYSALSPTLLTLTNDPGAQLIDTADDARPDAANTLSFTIDLGSCLRRAGLSFAGQRASVEIDARGTRSGDLVSQQIYVTMPV